MVKSLGVGENIIPGGSLKKKKKKKDLGVLWRVWIEGEKRGVLKGNKSGIIHFVWMCFSKEGKGV